MTAINSVTDLTREGDIAVLTINSPPVNALSAEVRNGLRDGAQQAAADPAVKAIVLICAGRTFIAGADIAEFGKPQTGATLPDIQHALEGSPKPVIAALHGTALGGGFEVALMCHYRVAVPSAKVGLPEIKLGLMPGAGGTQRLPRLAGVENALNLILSGSPFGAKQALDWKVVDAVGRGRQAARRRDRFRPQGDRHQHAAAPHPRSQRDDRRGARQAGNLRQNPQGERAQIPRL